MTGRDNVRQYGMRQWGILDPRVEPVAIEEDEGDRTVARVHQVVRDLAGNAIVDQFVGHVYAIREGLIARMDIRELDSKRSAAVAE